MLIDPVARHPKSRPEYIKKSSSRLMRTIGWFLRPFNERFMSGFWTTIHKTVYTPSRYDNDQDYGTRDWLTRNKWIVGHESTHVAQYEKYGILFDVLYLGPSSFLLPLALFLWALSWAAPVILWTAVGVTTLGVVLAPLSVGFAWWRWLWEREAYLPRLLYLYRHNEARGLLEVERVVSSLWANYLFTWPRDMMKTWFISELKKRRARLPPPA